MKKPTSAFVISWTLEGVDAQDEHGVVSVYASRNEAQQRIGLYRELKVPGLTFSLYEVPMYEASETSSSQSDPTQPPPQDPAPLKKLWVVDRVEHVEQYRVIPELEDSCSVPFFVVAPRGGHLIQGKEGVLQMVAFDLAEYLNRKEDTACALSVIPVSDEAFTVWGYPDVLVTVEGPLLPSIAAPTSWGSDQSEAAIAARKKLMELVLQKS